jgi:hypothetical protein
MSSADQGPDQVIRESCITLSILARWLCLNAIAYKPLEIAESTRDRLSSQSGCCESSCAGASSRARRERAPVDREEEQRQRPDRILLKRRAGSNAQCEQFNYTESRSSARLGSTHFSVSDDPHEHDRNHVRLTLQGQSNGRRCRPPSGCCARAASDHAAAAPPSSVMNSRRFTAMLPCFRRKGYHSTAALRDFSLAYVCGSKAP